MAEYTARVLELDQEFAAIRREVAKLNPIGAPIANLSKFAEIDLSLKAYAELREKALTLSVPFVIPGADATAESQQLKWSTELNRHGSDAFQRFNDLVKSEDDPLQLGFELIAMQEAAAYSVFARMPLAGVAGQIRAHLRRLEVETRTLQDAWREQSGQTERMDGQVATVRAQVLDTFKRAVAEIRGWGPKTEAALQLAADAWSTNEGADPEPSVGSSGAEASKNIMATIDLLRRTHEEATRAALPVYAGKLTIHQMFANTRQLAKEFFDKVNPNTVELMVKEARDASKAAVALFHKPGLRQDAELFLSKVVVPVNELMLKFNEEWSRFYEAFRGIYFEEPTEATLEKLAEAEFFNRFWRDVQSLDLPGVFRIAEDAIARCESITAARITPEQKKKLETVIKARTAEMKEAIRRMDMSIFERAKLFYFDIPVDQIKDRVKRLPGFRK